MGRLGNIPLCLVCLYRQKEAAMLIAQKKHVNASDPSFASSLRSIAYRSHPEEKQERHIIKPGSEIARSNVLNRLLRSASVEQHVQYSLHYMFWYAVSVYTDKHLKNHRYSVIIDVVCLSVYTDTLCMND